MSPIAIAAIIMLVLLFLNVPVFASVLGACVTYFVLNPSAGLDGMLAMQRVISGMQSVPMLAIPFFVTAGALMNYCGITDRMLKFCKVLTGHMYGGLGQVNIVLSTLMGGMSGSSLAGIVPAVILCVAMMIIVSKYSKKRGIPRLSEKRASGGELWEAFKPAILPLCLPIIIIGSIRLGICTPTEAGAVAIAYAVILGIVYKEIRWDNVLTCIRETVCSTASIMLIVGAASCFSWILTWENVPQTMTTVLISVCKNKYIFLLAVNIFLLVVGMFIEATAAQIVLAPMLVPVATAFGIDPVHFGMVFIFNMALGSLTPPMGNLMFVTCGVTKCPTEEFLKDSVVFYILIFAMLMLMTYVPFISTWLPNLLYGV